MGSMMGSMSIWHWLILLVYLFVLGYPVTRILMRGSTAASIWSKRDWNGSSGVSISSNCHIEVMT